MTLPFPVLLDSSIRISVVALLVGLVLALARVRSGSLRHTAWLAVLCAMPLMPILLSVAPPIRVPISIASAVIEPSADLLPIETPSAFPEPSGPVASQAPVTLPRASRPPVWPATIVFVYTLVLLTLLWRLAAGWLSIQRVLRSSKRISVQNVTVYESPMVATPLTVGLTEQKILLPQDWNQWSEEKLRAVLAHELAHVERRDTVTSLLARLNCSVFWFHPLAWWLERQLVIAAEHACDDAGVRALGENRKYAEVLLDIAEAVRRRGSRLSWQGAGVDGTGLLGQRIDRILRGGPFIAVSVKQKVSVTVSCALAIVLVAACRESSIYTRELKPDPEYAADRAKQAAAEEFSNAARGMNAQQVADLEAALKKNPEDLDARKKLMIFYQASARNNPEYVEAIVKGNPEDPGERKQLMIYQSSGRETPGNDRALSAFRTHKLWFIQNHPENELAWMMNPQSDPAGDTRARKLWLAVIERENASSAELSGAASFFERTRELQLAEKIMLRAQAADPNGKWSRRFATIYSSVLTGTDSKGSYAQEIRKKLDESRDPVLLSAVGSFLASAGRRPAGNPDLVAMSKSYFERALQLDPNSTWARVGLASFRRVQLAQAIGKEPSEDQYKKVSTLPEADRFEYLPFLAEHAYIRGEMLEYYQHDLPGAQKHWELARRYAQDALRLAPRFGGDANYGAAFYQANMTLGMVAMRVDGDKRAAAKYMLAASKTPTADDFREFTLKLPVVLLRYGGPDERKAVIEYLERYGKIVQRPDLDLLKAAKQLREGYMPIWYQYQAEKLK